MTLAEKLNLKKKSDDDKILNIDDVLFSTLDLLTSALQNDEVSPEGKEKLFDTIMEIVQTEIKKNAEEDEEFEEDEEDEEMDYDEYEEDDVYSDEEDEDYDQYETALPESKLEEREMTKTERRLYMRRWRKKNRVYLQKLTRLRKKHPKCPTGQTLQRHGENFVCAKKDKKRSLAARLGAKHRMR